MIPYRREECLLRSRNISKFGVNCCCEATKKSTAQVLVCEGANISEIGHAQEHIQLICSPERGDRLPRYNKGWS